MRGRAPALGAYNDGDGWRVIDLRDGHAVGPYGPPFTRSDVVEVMRDYHARHGQPVHTEALNQYGK